MTQGRTASVKGFGGFGPVAQLVMADHEMLIELLACRVFLEPKFKTVDSSFPFTVLLVLFARFRYEPEELAPQALAGNCAPWMTSVSGQETSFVQLNCFFEKHLFPPVSVSLRHRVAQYRLKRPDIHPALCEIQADLAVLKKNDIITADQLP
jgi:hypothetical protein